MKEPVGILAAACHLPARKRTVEELFQQERIALSSEIAARLGIGQVPIRNDQASETASNMAVAAGREALQRDISLPPCFRSLSRLRSRDHKVPRWRCCC